MRKQYKNKIKQMLTRRKQKISFLFCVALIACVGISSATRIPATTTKVSDLYCQKFDQKGKCLTCCKDYYLDQDTGLCTKVSVLCATWDEFTGECLSCFPGYGQPLDGACSEIPVDDCGTVNIVDLNCKCYNDDRVCITCFSGYHLDENNFCVTGDDTNCDHCVHYGYVDTNGKYSNSFKKGCIPVCTECEEGYYLDCNNKCQKLPDNCASVDETGTCTDCIDDYEFDINGDCVLVTVDQEDNCAEYWWINSKGKWFQKWVSGCLKICKKCNDGYYLNSDYECIQYPPHCTDVNDQQQCTCCSIGYKLNNYHECIPIISTIPDDHCASYCYVNEKGNKFSKWVLGCKKVCKECDEGYYLDYDNNCVELPEHCQEADENGECTKCEDHYEPDQYGECIPIAGGPCDDHCAVYQWIDVKGNFYSKWTQSCKRICKVCGAGYSLDNDGTCIKGSDPLCVSTNIDGSCDVCAPRSVRGKLGRCIQVDGQCSSWDNVTALCTGCYGGYKLVLGKCVVA